MGKPGAEPIKPPMTPIQPDPEDIVIAPSCHDRRPHLAEQKAFRYRPSVNVARAGMYKEGHLLDL